MAEVVRVIGARPLLREVLLDPATLRARAAPPKLPLVDRAIEWLLIALLAFSPAAFGVVETWSETVVIAAAATLTILLALKLLLRPRVGFVWTLAYMPLALFVLVVLFQLIPLPEEIFKAIAPGAHGLKARLLADVPDA